MARHYGRCKALCKRGFYPDDFKAIIKAQAPVRFKAKVTMRSRVRELRKHGSEWGRERRW